MSNSIELPMGNAVVIDSAKQYANSIEMLTTSIKREREACLRVVQSTAKMYPDDPQFKSILETLYAEMILRPEPTEETMMFWSNAKLDEDYAQDNIL